MLLPAKRATSCSVKRSIIRDPLSNEAMPWKAINALSIVSTSNRNLFVGTVNPPLLTIKIQGASDSFAMQGARSRDLVPNLGFG